MEQIYPLRRCTVHFCCVAWTRWTCQRARRSACHSVSWLDCSCTGRTIDTYFLISGLVFNCVYTRKCSCTGSGCGSLMTGRIEMLALKLMCNNFENVLVQQEWFKTLGWRISGQACIDRKSSHTLASLRDHVMYVMVHAVPSWFSWSEKDFCMVDGHSTLVYCGILNWVWEI